MSRELLSIEGLFAAMQELTVVVIGDVMLDTYWWGHVERISPEAPVPVVAVDRKEQRIGGAANVALNARAMGAKVYMLSVTGNDDDGQRLSQLLNEKGIDTQYTMRSGERITTNKIRIISRNQQMMRLDAEMTNDLSATDTTALLQTLDTCLEEVQPDVVILEDYNKGVLTETVIRATIDRCIAKKIITAVDPKRKNFFAYRETDIFKPNLKEVREALNLLGDDVSETALADIHRQLSAQLQHRVSFITLSERGVFYQDGEDRAIIPSHRRNIADVSGAGDTVIAVASMVYAQTKDARRMAAIANIAGGLVCEEVGTAAIDPVRLLAECKRLLV
jgi:D-glycero-beta-D-manno-heptose-7-phosphate kinase